MKTRERSVSMLLRRALLATCVFAAACNGSALYAPPPPPPEEIIVRVYGDPDEPVVDAEIGAGQGMLGRTDATGTAKFKLDGADGSRFDLAVTCPADHGGSSRPF